MSDSDNARDFSGSLRMRAKQLCATASDIERYIKIKCR